MCTRRVTKHARNFNGNKELLTGTSEYNSLTEYSRTCRT